MADGQMVIVVDDEDRENEGDLCMAADAATAEAINFMVTHGRGLVCLPMTEERLRALELPMMVRRNTSAFGTGFTVSIEAKEGVTTGISAADRAHTIRTAVSATATAADLARPGHIFPLRARAGGVRERRGQTEASVDLARLAGRAPAAIICEILSADGTMARRPELERFAQTHGMPIVSVEQLVAYREAREGPLGSPRTAGAAEMRNDMQADDAEMAATEGAWQAEGLRVEVVAARFNEQVTERLVQGARDTWRRLGGRPADFRLTWVPGAFELPLVARRLAEARTPDAVVALGAVVRGDTPHFDFVAAQSAAGCMQAGIATGVPVLYGVLTCNTMEQAMARAGQKAGNKGADALLAAVETANVLRQVAERR
jgi:6,7-dimethyl-8-ribityllumazine synthase